MGGPKGFDESDAIYAQHGIDIPQMRREYEERTSRPCSTTTEMVLEQFGTADQNSRRRRGDYAPSKPHPRGSSHRLHGSHNHRPARRQPAARASASVQK